MTTIEAEPDFSVPTMDDSALDALPADPVITITVGDDPNVSGVLTESILAPSSNQTHNASTSLKTSAPSPVLRNQTAAIAGLILANTSVSKIAEEVVHTIRKDGLKNIRPWAEFFSSQKLAFPAPREIIARVPSNLRYFQANYLFVFVALALYSVITSPSLLFAAIGMGALAVYLLYLRKDPIIIFGHSVSDQHRVAIVLAMSLILCIFTSAASTLIWMGLMACISIAIHSALWSPGQEELFSSP